MDLLHITNIRLGKDIHKTHIRTHMYIHTYMPFILCTPRGIRVLIEDVCCTVQILITNYKIYFAIPRHNTKKKKIPKKKNFYKEKLTKEKTA